jgi:hypothetical protein
MGVVVALLVASVKRLGQRMEGAARWRERSGVKERVAELNVGSFEVL